MSKRIVVCLDGTWNDEEKMKHGELALTNVKKLHDALSPSAEQSLGYFPGVGTKLGQKIRGGTLGYGLFEQVKHGYQFIVDRYEPGDILYLFGFSRGAYCARSLGGMLAQCGVLRRDAVPAVNMLDVSKLELEVLEQDDKLNPPTAIDKTFLMYKRAADPSFQADVARFKQQHCHDTNIGMIGVWDTVGAMGLPEEVLHGLFKRFVTRLDDKRFGFLDTTLSPRVEAAYHAVAIDEHRKTFAPTLWTGPRINQPGKNVEQVWFAGAHSDVGGGYPEDALSNLALAWMIDKARQHGLTFTAEREQAILTDCDACGTLHDSLKSFVPLLGGILIEHGILQGLAREIVAGSWLHASVNARLAGDTNYAPKSLRVVDSNGKRLVEATTYTLVS